MADCEGLGGALMGILFSIESANCPSSIRLRRLWWGLLLSLLALLLFTEILPWGHRLDMLISDALYQRDGHRFYFNQNNGWVERVMHVGFRNALLLIPAYSLIQVLYGGWRWRRNALNGFQNAVWRRWCSALLAVLLLEVLVFCLKRWSNQACPWSLTDFGGIWPYTDLFATKPWGAAQMACWPAGHATGGFSLVIFYFIAGWPPNVWDARLHAGSIVMPQWLGPRAFLIYAVLLGSVLGVSRVAQGAHFFTHQLWALWWVVCACAFFVQTRIIHWADPSADTR